MTRVAVSHAGGSRRENNSPARSPILRSAVSYPALLRITKNSGPCRAATNVSRVQLPGSGATFLILLHFPEFPNSRIWRGSFLLQMAAARSFRCAGPVRRPAVTALAGVEGALILGRAQAPATIVTGRRTPVGQNVLGQWQLAAAVSLVVALPAGTATDEHRTIVSRLATEKQRLTAGTTRRPEGRASPHPARPANCFAKCAQPRSTRPPPSATSLSARRHP